MEETSLTNSTTCLNFNQTQSHQIGIVRGVTGLATIVICLVALATILCLRAYKTYAHRLFLYLALVTLLQAPTYTLEVMLVSYKSDEPDQPLCSVTGVYAMYICWLQNLIVLWITGYLFRVIVLRVIMQTKKVEIAVGITFLFLPIPFALIPLINNHYGMVGVWCWIRNTVIGDCSEQDWTGLAFQYSLWFVPVILEVIVISVILTIIVIVLFARAFIVKKYVPFQYEYRRLLRDSLPLLVFPIFFSIISCFELALYMQSAQHKPIFGLWMLNAIITPCKGILMISTYLIPMIWVRMKDWFRKKTLVLRKEEWIAEENSSVLDNTSVRFLSSGGQDCYGSVEIVNKKKKQLENGGHKNNGDDQHPARQR